MSGMGLSLRLEDICKQGCRIHLRQTFVWVVSLPLVYCLSPSQLDWSEYTDVSWRNDNNNNIFIYKAQLHKSAQSAVQLLRNAYKTYKLMMCVAFVYKQYSSIPFCAQKLLKWRVRWVLAPSMKSTTGL